MLHRHFTRVVAIASVFAIAASFLVSQAVFAAGPPQPEKVIPKIVVQEDGWLVITFGGPVQDKVAAAHQLDAFLTNAVTGKNSSAGVAPQSILSLNQMTGFAQESYFNPDDISSSFTTTASWSSSPASVSGTSSTAYWGHIPEDADQIMVDHLLEVDGGYFTNWPSNWYHGASQTWSPQQIAYSTWYLGTSWSALSATYSGSGATLHQKDTAQVYFNGYNPEPDPLYPQNYLDYGY